jgi:hypothetical protein
LYAVWTADTDTTYKVNHWQQKINGGSALNSTNYEKVNTEVLSGVTNTTVTPNRKTYTGFKSPSGKSLTIKADGSAYVDYYYERNKYKLTVDPNGGSWNSSSAR